MFHIPDPLLLSICSQYSNLCLFSNITTKIDVNELFDRITKSEEFIEFMEHNKDKTGKEVCREFLLNTIYSMAEQNVGEVLEDPELKKIFENKSFSKNQRFSAFIGKAIVKVFVRAEGAQELMQHPIFQQWVTEGIAFFNNIRGDKEITSPEEAYHLVVENAVDNFMKMLHKRLDTLRLGDDDPQNLDHIYDSCIGMIDRFNNTLNYRSKYAGNKRKRDEKDDDNSNNDSSKHHKK